MQRVGNVIRSKQKSLVECDMSKRRNASSHCFGHIQFYQFQTWHLEQTIMLINIFVPMFFLFTLTSPHFYTA